MENIKIKINKSQDTNVFCKKVIDADTIVLSHCNTSVKYYRQNGFHLYDLIYLFHRQYLYVANDDVDVIFNEDEIDWNSDPYYGMLEHSLDYFEYDPGTGIVECIASH